MARQSHDILVGLISLLKATTHGSETRVYCKFIVKLRASSTLVMAHVLQKYLSRSVYFFRTATADLGNKLYVTPMHDYCPVFSVIVWPSDWLIVFGVYASPLQTVCITRVTYIRCLPLSCWIAFRALISVSPKSPETTLAICFTPCYITSTVPEEDWKRKTTTTTTTEPGFSFELNRIWMRCSAGRLQWHGSCSGFIFHLISFSVSH